MASSHILVGLPSGITPFGFPTKILFAFIFSHIRTTCPVHIILFDFIILIVFGEGSSVFSNLLLCHPSWVQTFFPAPCSQELSVCVLPSMSETKFHTCTNLYAKIFTQRSILPWML
jgi:hypothetical protein